MISSYRDLHVWQRAMGLAEATYSLTNELPPYETYGLGQQLRRSAVSVVSNIAEGHGRAFPRITGRAPDPTRVGLAASC
jgi:hypothetical protein